MANTDKPSVAYFCMEYGLNNKLNIYAGGLGILAGDMIKSAKEQDYPMVAVGILWRKGYTKQFVGRDDRPYDTFPENDDMYKYLFDTGVKFDVNIKNDVVTCKVWELQGFNNIPLYLMDTNLPENENNKWITQRLYEGDIEERVAQEIILGIGGVKALPELGYNIDVYHFNEGHAVLGATELIKKEMEKGLGFEEAWGNTRKKIVFTTHTPVQAGNESHSLDLLDYMGAYNGLTREQMIQIGDDPFNMTIAGLRLSYKANAVSSLHGETTQKMYENVSDKAPIISITNGVHQNTWIDPGLKGIDIKGPKLWETHQNSKTELINFIEKRTGVRLQEDKLTIGFARRAACYKRPDLIFRKPEVINQYLENGSIQLVFSGKAHPSNDEGKDIIFNLIQMTKKFPNSVVFLEDYDIEVAQNMIRGVDVWLNNPIKPREASGTSGMKAAMNGVLNLSILDGWWPEACNHGENGWQFGDGYVGEDQDQHDLDALYKVLLDEVMPTYYDNRDKWIEMMRDSINTSRERFSAKRMVKDYYEQMYIPAYNNSI